MSKTHYECEREAAWTVYRATITKALHLSQTTEALMRDAFLAGFDAASGELEADMYGEAA